MKTERKITNGPRVYMAGDTVNKSFRNPVRIEIVVEGNGTIDAEALTHAVDAASRANPGTRLIARRKFYATRLVDSGITPPVRQIDGSGWSGHDAQSMPFFRYPMPIHSGPTCDVIMMTGPPTRIMFRGHHTVIDGQGMMMWIVDVFRALRGEKPLGSSWVESVDQFRRITPVKETKWSGGQCVAPTGMPQNRTSRVAFSRAKLPGPISDLMPRLMMLTARTAWQYNPTGRVVFGVPISLRHRKPKVRSTSNLSRAVYIEIKPETTITDIDRAIHRHLQTDGRLSFIETIIPFLPLWVLGKSIENEYRKGFDTGRYWVSGIVSNFGRFKKNQFSASGFTAQSIYALPPSSCSTPIFFILLGLDDMISISASMPESLASGDRLNAFMAHIKRGLSPCSGPPVVSGSEYPPKKQPGLRQPIIHTNCNYFE